MDATYREILQRGSSHDDYIMGLFNNLLASTNTIFTDFIQHEKDRWENGTDIHPDVLISEAITNIIIWWPKWNGIKLSQQIPKLPFCQHSQIIYKKNSFVTHQRKGGKNNSCQGEAGNGKHGLNGSSSILKLCLSKTLGNKVEKDRKTWCWCHKHHND